MAAAPGLALEGGGDTKREEGNKKDAESGSGCLWVFAIFAVMAIAIATCSKGPDTPGVTTSTSTTSSSQSTSSTSDLRNQIATIINLNGHLCAEAVNVSALAQPNTYEVRCIEYRGGTGTVDYILNAKTGIAYKR